MVIAEIVSLFGFHYHRLSYKHAAIYGHSGIMDLECELVKESLKKCRCQPSMILLIMGCLNYGKKRKQPVHHVQMTEGKQDIIQQLLQEHDIKTTEDIQDALKDFRYMFMKVYTCSVLHHIDI